VAYKLYTGAGDKGETRLFGCPTPMAKDSPRVTAYGTVDELNAFIGVCRASNKDSEIDGILAKVQSELFVVGSDLAAPLDAETTKKIPRIDDNHIKSMELTIDDIASRLEEIRKFVLPGGSSGAAHLHLARAVCRRAERDIVTLAKKEKINPHIIAYINRLSSLLYALARLANQKARVEEVLWESEK